MQRHQLDHMQTICTSLQITTPKPHHSVFTGRMLFLTPNQEHQSTGGSSYRLIRRRWRKKDRLIPPRCIRILCAARCSAAARTDTGKYTCSRPTTDSLKQTNSHIDTTTPATSTAIPSTARNSVSGVAMGWAGWAKFRGRRVQGPQVPGQTFLPRDAMHPRY